MPWYVLAFSKTGDEGMLHRHLVDVDEAFVRRVWSITEDDYPVFGAVYPVKPELDAEHLRPLLHDELDFETYHYELSYEID